MKLFSLRKICRICPQHRGSGPPAPAHGSTDFIKRWSLATRSTAQIKPIESVSWLLISVVHHRSDGWGSWLALAVARRDRARWLIGVQVFSSHDGRFSMRFAPTGSQRWGKHVYANLNPRRAATRPGNGEAAWPVLSTVRAASGEASAPRTCAKASLGSVLTSRPTNCSDRW
jgi:hypothetical protein